MVSSSIRRGSASVAVLAAHQALVEQRGQAIQHGHAEAAVVADRLDRLQGAAAGEHRQPREQALLGGVEQIVAPVERGPEGLLAGGQVPCAPDKQLQTALESANHRLGGQQLDPGGRQLDGQRQPVQSGADVGHCRCIRRGDDKVRLGCCGALGEQRDSVAARQWGDVVLLLPRDVQGLSAGHDHLQPGTGDQQAGDERRGRDQVLEVVQQEQQLAVLELLSQALLQRLPAGLPDPECPGDGRPDQERVTDWGQRDEERAVAELVHQRVGGLEGEAGLARTPRAGERQQPRRLLPEQPSDLDQLPLPPDQHGQLGRQVGRPMIQTAHRREVGRQARHDHLEQSLRLGEVLKSVFAEIT
jgi:hypothetical protein